MNQRQEHIESLSESKLVEFCIEGDRKCQELLYRRYAKKMFVVCKRYAKDGDEAMDFLQEGFIEVFRKLKNYRNEGSLEGWVRKVIVYRSIDALRREKRYHEVNSEFHSDIITEPEEYDLQSAANITADKIRELVNQLPGKAGLVLKLFALEGLSHREIAEYLEISEGTSKSQLNRARSLLKAALASG